jgi:hypothetical protein
MNEDESQYVFDVKSELETLKNQTKEIRKRVYKARTSQLDNFKYELKALHKSGVSIAELQRFLLSKRTRVTHSTVSRWIKKNG